MLRLRAESHHAPGLFLLCLLAGCQTLIGLDDAPKRTGDAGSRSDAAGTELDDGAVEGSDGATTADSGVNDPAITASCTEFCQGVGSQCDGMAGPVAYYSQEACVAVCKYYDRADNSTTGNSFSCRAARLSSLKVVSAVDQAERDALCAAASVGGGTSLKDTSCGDNCTSYCTLFHDRCDKTLDVSECKKQCAALQDTGGVNAKDDFGSFPDTVQCRLAHLSVAAADPKEMSAHCMHATLVPHRASDADVQCDLKDMDRDGKPLERPVLCENYCHVVSAACAGTDAVYESETQCRKACENPNGIPQGRVLDSTGDTLGCRRWHAYTAVNSKLKQHCSHANVIGGGHCGNDACVAYCNLADRVCGNALALSPLRDVDGCLHACGADLPGAENVAEVPYNVDVGKRNGNTLQCRIFQLTRALAGETPADVANACRGAVGGSPCAAGG